MRCHGGAGSTVDSLPAFAEDRVVRAAGPYRPLRYTHMYDFVSAARPASCQSALTRMQVMPFDQFTMQVVIFCPGTRPKRLRATFP